MVYSAPRPSILVIDDEPDNFAVLAALLANEDYDLHFAPGPLEGMAQAQSLDPDLILLDFMMPQLNGAEVCGRIKAGERTRLIPIIVVTALSSKEALAHCLMSGADDFIGKPVSGLELRARIRSMLRIRSQHRENDVLLRQLTGLNAELREFNHRLDMQVQDRTADLQRSILFHPLTGLPSRALLLQRIWSALERCRSSAEEEPFALIHLDCAQFHQINGTFGHDIGDALLIAVGERLQTILGAADLLSHPGGDEFCLLLDVLTARGELAEAVTNVLRLFEQPFRIDACEFYLSVYAGAVLVDARYLENRDVLRDADSALYKAKSRSKGSFEIFAPDLQRATAERLSLENDLRHALNNGEFCMHYQPILQLEDRTLWGFEALVRWNHPDRGLIFPDSFIGCAEESGLIVRLGRVILDLVCQQFVTWRDQGFGSIRLAVNLSARQFGYGGLLDDVDRILLETGADPAYLEFEITETALMEHPEASVETLRLLKARKIRLSLDDFGTGYSSLSYLQRFPIDILKIDRCFIQTLEESQQNTSLVEAILSMSQALGIGVIAEGIETEAQLRKLRSMGAKLGQGYLFSKPVTAGQASDLIQRRDVH